MWDTLGMIQVGYGRLGWNVDEDEEFFLEHQADAAQETTYAKVVEEE